MEKEVTQWEYESLYIHRGGSTIKKLDEMGLEGWELCGFDVERNSCGCEYGTYFIFKRPLKT